MKLPYVAILYAATEHFHLTATVTLSVGFVHLLISNFICGSFDIDMAKTRKRKPAAKLTTEWLTGDSQKLIQLVQPHKCLYDIKFESHKFKSVREDAWKLVSDGFNGKYNAEQCGVKWRSLRGRHRTILAEQKRNPDLTLPSWRFFPLMQALVIYSLSTNVFVSISIVK